MKMNANQDATIDNYIARADLALRELVFCRLGLDGMGACVQAGMLQKAVSMLESQIIAMSGKPDAVAAEPSEIEQLVALIEARQFPIDVAFTDPLARSLYAAFLVLMGHASIAGQQTTIARRHINAAMAEMGNNQGGYYHLKKCLEEMNAQEQGEAAVVVLCRQYQEELNEVIPAAIAVMTDLRAIADGMQKLAPNLMDSLGQADEAPKVDQELKDTTAILRTAADLLTSLMEFAGYVPPGSEETPSCAAN